MVFGGELVEGEVIVLFVLIVGGHGGVGAFVVRWGRPCGIGAVGVRLEVLEVLGFELFEDVVACFLVFFKLGGCELIGRGI